MIKVDIVLLRLLRGMVLLQESYFLKHLLSFTFH
jgi:hypothetical protein